MLILDTSQFCVSRDLWGFLWLCQVLTVAHGVFHLHCNVRSLAEACEFLLHHMGSNPGPLPWELGVSAIGSAGKSLDLLKCKYATAI